MELARELAQRSGGEIITYPSFRTAKVKWEKWSVDLATARSETYPRPGALPRVKPDTIIKDLSRRDFTINALAVDLTPARFGELIDPYGGEFDLKNRLIRVLHERSFQDDATRIWRAIRYEQRLDFTLEPTTLLWLKRDLSYLDTISGDRIKYELECALAEKLPEKVLQRAGELGVLARLHPVLKGDGWLGEKFAQARRLYHPDPPPMGLYLALLTYPLAPGDIEELSSYLRLSQSLGQILRDVSRLKAKLDVLSAPGIAPSAVYATLKDYSPLAITALSLATEWATARRHLQLFLSELRQVKPLLTGDDLKKLGIPPGPRIKQILEHLRQARLDGKAKTR
ncbi:MAG: CCA tRNA nucleotidyltransferase, partial [Chloroflexota bacterium]